MLRVGIYNRCSTEEEAQINALETQVLESMEIVEGKGWVIAGQYIESESGTTSQKRSEYQRLLEDMEIDKFDIVVIKSIDRLMRSAKDWYIFLDKLTQNRKQLYIYIDNKFYTPEDSLITGIKAILAEDFSRELSKKIKNAHRRRQDKQSGLNITNPMFGWDKIGKNEFVINEEEAAGYRLAFELAAQGNGFHRIARILYESGVRSKRGKRIDETQWRNMIYSPRAHGTVILRTTEYDFETKKRRKLPEKEWIYVENALPPIVSKEYQEVVLQKLEERKKNNTKERGVAAALYELSGKMYCANCGKPYYRIASLSGEREFNMWKCSTALRQGRKTKDNPWGCNNINVLEDVVFEKMQENCKMYSEVLLGCWENGVEEAVTEAAMAMIHQVFRKNDSGNELAKWKKELEKLEKKKNVLLAKLVDEVITDADFKIANQVLSENIKQVQQKVNAIQSQTTECCNEKRLHKIREALFGGVTDVAKMRELIQRLEKIIIYPEGRMEILFRKWDICKSLKEDETGQKENCIRIFAAYEHKTYIVRRRERIKVKILQLFRENPDLMLKEVPEIVGMGESYVNAIVKELKKKGALRYERKGNTHTGRWIVNDKVLV